MFRINEDFHLIDLPGYGFAKVSKAERLKWSGMLEGYFAASGLLCHVLHLVDLRHEPTGEDRGMNEFLRATGIPFTVIATKADKLSRAQRQRQVLAICRGLQVQPWEVIPISSEDAREWTACWPCWEKPAAQTRSRTPSAAGERETAR